MTKPTYLIWINTHGKLSPQVLYEGLGKPDAGVTGRLVSSHPIAASDAHLSFDELVARYPAPVSQTDGERG